MRAILVSHTHWDREWYRTFQAFRARLVDAVDRVLDLCAADPGYCFLLDGQTAALEDYLEIRPARADELAARCREGRIAVGPWYVQPDSLLPSGEAHVRNLLEGRHAAEPFGGASLVGYTPDSFGHPAQLPQLLAGFGLRAFVYWRGNGDEIDALPAEYTWVAPDGSGVLACHLGRGYFNAASDPRDPLGAILEPTAARAKELAARTRSGAILLMNGIDHAPPTAETGALAERLAEATGFEVQRGLLEDFVDAVVEAGPERPEHRGELIGARVSPLLPGVWSTRTWIKLESRAAEAGLEGWAEPFAALAERVARGAAGTPEAAPDERPALRLAWRELLRNQAHDSLCGCSRDEVHEQMRGRFDAAKELAFETAERSLAWLAGQDATRFFPWSDAPSLAVFNPSPHPRSDVLRFRFEPHPYMVPAAQPGEMVHPAALPGFAAGGFEVEGRPVRVVAEPGPGRLSLLPDQPGVDLECVVRDVPAFGWKRVELVRVPPERAVREEVEEVIPGSPDASIEAGALRAAVLPDGRFRFEAEGRVWDGLGGLEDLGDRGDSYDFDPLAPENESPLELESVRVWRHQHPAGLSHLEIERRLSLPVSLAPGREKRSEERVVLPLRLGLRLAEGVPRLDLRVRLENTARDHRLRLLFPLGPDIEAFEAASTFDVAQRRPGPQEATGWVQAAPATFPHQGFVRAAGLQVCAPGLPEAEMLEVDGVATLALTLLRAVGDLSRHDLRSRPGPAGPGLATPGAQCPGHLEARLSLLAEPGSRAARDAELGLRAVAEGAAPRWPEGAPLLTLEPAALELTALKPALAGPGLVARVLNPTDAPLEAELRCGFELRSARSLRLDETPDGEAVERDGSVLRFPVPARGLRTLLLD